MSEDRCTTGKDDYHFQGYCDHCDVRRVLSMNLMNVQDAYRTGRVGQELYEAYMHVWANSATHFSSVGGEYRQEPTDPRVRYLVELIKRKK